MSMTERLAASLEQLAELQVDGRRVFHTSELARADRERLTRGGFMRPVMRGWLVSCSPTSEPGDTTPWYSCFWEFCARYCAERFGDHWHVSPEQSLLLHAENTVVPRQVVIYSPTGTNNTIDLPYGTSLYDLRERRVPPASELTVRDEVRLYTAEAALLKVPESFLAKNPTDARAVLSNIGDASGLLRLLLDGGHPVIAGRLAGAFRQVGQGALADDIVSVMMFAGHEVRETFPLGGAAHDPASSVDGSGLRAPVAPIVERLRAMWASCRGPVIDIFPVAPGLPADPDDYLHAVDAVYDRDAYHSLSIEGYRVTPDLVGRVRSGRWDPDYLDHDRRSRDALAAHGYWQAFQLVREAVAGIVAGGDPIAAVESGHDEWYRALLAPSVAAGVLEPSSLAGYRNHAVFIRGSRHVPVRWEAVRDAMPALFELFAQESEPSVRAVLGHWLFGYIHPYPDGNGRLARFLMNALLAAGGYPWTIIQVGDRADYLAALERASTDLNVAPFARFLADQVQRA